MLKIFEICILCLPLHWHQYVWMQVPTFCHIHNHTRHIERSRHMFLPLWKKDALRKSRPTNHLGFLAETGIFARLSIASWSTIATASGIEWQSRLSQFWSFKMAYIYPKWYSTWMPYMYAWGPHKRISLNLVSVIQVAVCIVTPKREGFRLQSENRI